MSEEAVQQVPDGAGQLQPTDVVAGAGQQTEAGELDDPMVAEDGESAQAAEEEIRQVCERCPDHVQLGAEYRELYKVEKERRERLDWEIVDLMKLIQNLRADNNELRAQEVELGYRLRNADQGSQEYKQSVLVAAQEFQIAVRNIATF
jgi:hypothetical protein